MRGSDRDRADRAKTVEEAEDEDEADRPPLDEGDGALEGGAGLRLHDPAMVAVAAAESEPALIGEEGAQRRRDHRAGQRDQSLVREDAARGHRGLALERGAREHRGDAPARDEGFDAHLGQSFPVSRQKAAVTSFLKSSSPTDAIASAITCGWTARRRCCSGLSACATRARSEAMSRRLA